MDHISSSRGSGVGWGLVSGWRFNKGRHGEWNMAGNKMEAEITSC